MNAELKSCRLRRFFRCLSFIILISALLSASPATQPSEQIRRLFQQLTDPDAELRDQAMQELMGLAASDLPTLRMIVEQSRPLSPAQTLLLRQIVLHVFLSQMEYQPDPAAKPFLGLQGPQSADEAVTAEGVVVQRRVAGFDAYRMLRDGDMIIGLEQKPHLRLDNIMLLSLALDGFAAGQTITLNIIRDGREIRVPVRLRAKPAGIEQIGLEAWMHERLEAAEQYWQQNFAPLILENYSEPESSGGRSCPLRLPPVIPLGPVERSA